MDLDRAPRDLTSNSTSIADSSASCASSPATRPAQSNSARQAALIESGSVEAADSGQAALSGRQVDLLGHFGIGPENLDDEAQARMAHALERLDGMLACNGGDEAACEALGSAPINLTETTNATQDDQEILLEEADYRLSLQVRTDPLTGQTTSRLLFVDVDGTCISGISEQPLETPTRPQPEASLEAEPAAASPDGGGLLATLDRINQDYHVLDRLGGAFQVFGAVTDLRGALPLLLAPEPTMATKVAAGAVGLRGLDDLQAGLRTLWTGEPVETVTQQISTAAALALGADPDWAHRIGVGVDMATGLLNPTSRLRQSTTEASERLAVAAGKNARREGDAAELVEEGRAAKKTAGTAEEQVTEAGLNKPVPLTPNELARVAEWQDLRNGFLKKWRDADLSAFPEKTQHLLRGSADNAVRKGMSPDDLAAVIKERRGVKIIDASGKVFDHRKEAAYAREGVVLALDQIKERIAYLIARSPDQIAEIQALEDKLSDLSELMDAYERLQ